MFYLYKNFDLCRHSNGTDTGLHGIVQYIIHQTTAEKSDDILSGYGRFLCRLLGDKIESGGSVTAGSAEFCL